MEVGIALLDRLGAQANFRLAVGWPALHHGHLVQLHGAKLSRVAFPGFVGGHKAKAHSTEITALGHEFFRLTLRFGFAEDPEIPAALQSCSAKGIGFDMMDTTFFISRESIVATDRPGMPVWRDKLFALMHRNAAPANQFFRIPGNRLVELGAQVEI